MEWIALLGPAALTMKIKLARNLGGEDKLCISITVFQYIIEIIKNSFLSICFITYFLRIDGGVQSNFESFPFWIKYVIIAVFFACICPFIEEVFHKCVNLKFYKTTKDSM